MEAAPTMDVSRPTGLRFAGFVLAIAGAALLGYGAISTWVTVGVRAIANNVDTAIPGVDLADGKVALVLAIVIFVAIVAARIVDGRPARMAIGAVIIAAGVIGAVLAGAFLQNGVDRHVVLDTLAVPREQWEAVEAFREYGVGPYLSLAGGVLAFFAGILTLAWAQRLAGAPEEPEPG